MKHFEPLWKIKDRTNSLIMDEYLQNQGDVLASL